VRDNKIEIREKIQFEYNKAIIREVSFDLMAEIADVIKKHPHIKKLRIEGHASAEGEDAYNKSLSDRRAIAVMKHLVEREGIPGEMLSAKGYGEEKPVAPNDTEENREKNRRVEFNIVEQDITQKKVEVDSTTGQEKLLEETKQRLKAPDADEDATAPAEPATGSKSAKSAMATKPVKHATATKPVKHATATKPVKPATATKPAKPVATPKPTKPVMTTKAAKPPAKLPAKTAAGKAQKKR
jgi:OOP family OmpA-OmpF porin